MFLTESMLNQIKVTKNYILLKVKVFRSSDGDDIYFMHHDT